MRAPPPVEMACAPGPAWRAALSVLAGLAAAVPLAWALPCAAAQWGGLPGAFSMSLVQGGLVVAVAVMTSGVFWLTSRRFDEGECTLRWDGQDWLLADGDRPGERGEAALMLDLGPWMLVRFAPQPGGAGRAARWLALGLGADPARWAAVRGALWNWGAGRGGARP